MSSEPPEDAAGEPARAGPNHPDLPALPRAAFARPLSADDEAGASEALRQLRGIEARPGESAVVGRARPSVPPLSESPLVETLKPARRRSPPVVTAVLGIVVGLAIGGSVARPLERDADTRSSTAEGRIIDKSRFEGARLFITTDVPYDGWFDSAPDAEDAVPVRMIAGEPVESRLVMQDAEGWDRWAVIAPDGDMCLTALSNREGRSGCVPATEFESSGLRVTTGNDITRGLFDATWTTTKLSVTVRES